MHTTHNPTTTTQPTLTLRAHSIRTLTPASYASPTAAATDAQITT